MLPLLFLALLFHRELRALLAPLTIRLWLWWQPRTVYGAKQARILTPVLAEAHGEHVLFTAQGLGVFARVCKDPQALGTVWLEGLLRAMLATGTPAHRIHLPQWGPAATHVATTFQQLTGQAPWCGAPGDFATVYGPESLVTLPWDPVAQIGNEWWCGMWGTSGDPAAACNTDISPTAQVDDTPFLHVKYAPPYLGGATTYQLLKWEGGTAVPVAHTDMAADPSSVLAQHLLHTLHRRAEIKCLRNSLQVTLDSNAPMPPVWTVKWGPETGVTVTSHHPEAPTASLPRNLCMGDLLVRKENYDAALALWPKRPPTVMGVGNDDDGLQRLVLWHEDSGPKLMLVPLEDWDEFAVQYDMPLHAEENEVLSECSYLQHDVAFHSPGNLYTHMGKHDWTDTTAHLAAVPGIAMEGYTALVATLLEPDRRTFRRA